MQIRYFLTSSLILTIPTSMAFADVGHLAQCVVRSPLPTSYKNIDANGNITTIKILPSETGRLQHGLVLRPEYCRIENLNNQLTTQQLTFKPKASNINSCAITPPTPYIYNLPSPTDTEETIRVSSKKTTVTVDESALFDGQVSFTQGSRKISADHASINNEKLLANGNLVFQDPQFTVTADSLNAKRADNSAILAGAQYWLHGRQIHGDAENLQVTGESDLLLNNSSFTTCEGEDKFWVLEAEKIKIDSNNEKGEIWDAKLKIADVPVFYFPYMTIPITDKRKTGFLFPTISSSTTDGFEVTTPFYWNIAPEYDLTFTPSYMSSRGLFTKTEFRYLAGDDQQGQLNFEYLPDDRLLTNNPNRYLYHWEHQGSLDENWRVLTDITEVSDNNYFNDLNSDINNATDNQLSRVGEANYYSDNWSFGAKVQDIKVLGEEDSPYQVLPQLHFNYRAPSFWKGLDFSVYSEITNFQNRDNDFTTATRVHVEPTLSYPIHRPAGSLTTELKLLQTNYWQDNISDPSLDDDVSRTLPQVRVNGQINFERFTDYFGNNYRQTVVPRFQYLYVGYEDQSDIELYDTAELQQDYIGLFRDRRYSGLDRISDENQVTLGLTTKLFNEDNVEEFKFSVGQTVYFEDSEVTLYDETIQDDDPSTSVLATELDAHLYQDWFIGGSLQYDFHNSENKKSEVTLEYRPETNKLLQFSYRYVADLINQNTSNQVNISQSGIRTAWPITDEIYFVGNWYYDLDRNRTVESYTGFQYESCCWAVQLSYHYRIKTNYEDDYDPVINNREQFETGVYLNFIIKGLGGSGPVGVSDMLNDGIFNYRKPLYLRN